MRAMSPTTPTVEGLLGDLAAAPQDELLRARAAEAHSAAGRDREAVELLAAGLVNLTAHDGPTLPCLCRRCLQPELVRAHADGLEFVRRFVVGNGRVLWYWAPAEIADDPGLARSVRSRLVARLAGGAA
jgi:hypothetical protein